MSWYRTYRPQTVSSLHIKTVRDTLLNMLQSGEIPHALLFAGSKGTGKTSSARIIAKVLNCEKNSKRKSGQPFQEPCNVCEMCAEITQGSSMNVIEMDGASNRRIDDIRALKERMYIPPARGRKVVYIIDEVHMLTKEAFNALLKMLEEPPEHVVFIFATTDAHKIPDTITSRCTRVQFTQASVHELRDALDQIAKVEKISAEKEALEQIAQSADGSFRDAVKLFEQLANQVKVNNSSFDASFVLGSLAVISQSGVKSLFEFILQKDERKIVSFFQDLRERQIDALIVHKQLLQYLHQELMKCFDASLGTSFSKQEVILFLLKQFSAVEIPLQHPFPLLPLELCALEMVLKSKEKAKAGSGGNSKSAVSTPAVVVKKVTVETKMEGAPMVDTDEEEEIEVVQIQTTLEKPTDVVGYPTTDPRSQIDGTLVGERWSEILKVIGQKNLSLEAILRSAQFVQGEQGKAVFKVYYGFHKDQLELQRYRMIVDQAIQELMGGYVQCEYVLSDQAKKQLGSADSNVTGKQDEELVSAIEDALL